MFETETVGPCLVWKLKWGGGPWPSWPPSSYAPGSSDFINKIEERSNTAFFQPNCSLDWSPGELLFLESMTM